ncbi:hypothetical protein O6H91_17G033100 [Diphasiastrum complanatum]|uniref:Uncharacterized protein n=1 Tax=Diphasiastrum complanatum TaxID=34168 RepID=A0ACC2B5G3_DIPCM|nr:hypothetical protein O6H91_17G033100 [Diphasiastrum complanatum]
MGCFPVTAVRGRKKVLVRNQTMVSNPLSLYDNKPAVLPKPLEIEEERYARTVSAPPSLANTLRSPSPNYQNFNKDLRNFYAPSTARIDQQADLASSSNPSTSPCRNLSFLTRNSANQQGASPWIHSVTDRWSESPVTLRSFGGLPLPLPPSQAIAHPLPLPVPCDESTGSPIYELRNISSTQNFDSSPCSTSSQLEKASGHSLISSLHHKLRSTPHKVVDIQASAVPFLFEEIARACQNFSSESYIGHSGAGSAYKARLYAKAKGETKAVCVIRSTKSMLQDQEPACMAEINRLSQLKHPNVCKLVGFCLEDNNKQSKERMKRNDLLLVYEQLPYGSLDKLLRIKQLDGQTLDWPTRIKVAVDAAQGLASLHEDVSGQILHKDFKLFHIQVDETYNAKVMGYGFVEAMAYNRSLFDKYGAPETAETGRIVAKSNVWNFGVVLLELLAGRKDVQEIFREEQMDPARLQEFLDNDSCKLIRGLDPQLKDRFPVKAVNVVADLILKCLQNEAELRPSMKEIAQILTSAQGLTETITNKTSQKSETRESAVNANPSSFSIYGNETVPLPLKMIT